MELLHYVINFQCCKINRIEHVNFYNMLATASSRLVVCYFSSLPQLSVRRDNNCFSLKDYSLIILNFFYSILLFFELLLLAFLHLFYFLRSIKIILFHKQKLKKMAVNSKVKYLLLVKTILLLSQIAYLLDKCTFVCLKCILHISYLLDIVTQIN